MQMNNAVHLTKHKSGQFILFFIFMDNQCLNCEKEVAERWKRGTDCAETNAEGVRIEAPCEGNGEGVSRSPTD